jgi:hypothetical protein
MNVASTDDQKDEVDKEFYQKPERAYNSARTSDTNLMFGDLNAKFGKEMGTRRNKGAWYIR